MVTFLVRSLWHGVIENSAVFEFFVSNFFHFIFHLDWNLVLLCVRCGCLMANQIIKAFESCPKAYLCLWLRLTNASVFLRSFWILLGDPPQTLYSKAVYPRNLEGTGSFFVIHLQLATAPSLSLLNVISKPFLANLLQN